MTTTRRYTWKIAPDRNVTWTARRFDALLANAMSRDPRITDAQVTLDGEGDDTPFPITVHMTVVGRDLHGAGQIAQDVIAGACIAAKARAMPLPGRLPPHTNRGYAGGRRKTTRTRSHDDRPADPGLVRRGGQDVPAQGNSPDRGTTS